MKSVSALRLQACSFLTAATDEQLTRSRFSVRSRAPICGPLTKRAEMLLSKACSYKKNQGSISALNGCHPGRSKRAHSQRKTRQSFVVRCGGCNTEITSLQTNGPTRIPVVRFLTVYFFDGEKGVFVWVWTLRV